MAEINRCPKCNAELPADAPAGFCPKCLLQAGYESQAGPSSAYRPTAASPPATGFVPPTVDELSKHFPQLEVIELLGKGGMGAVYKARQPGLDRLVAVKILPPEVGRDPAFAERFTREARALARLGHPNIVSVYDFGQRDGLFYIVMEYVDGVNLRQAILAGGMSPEQALAIVPQICDALQFAHDEGIVHRDIKPENILLDKRGRVKIADFGLAKLFGAAADHTLTGDHQVMGTLRYMAPEQLEGTHAVDHRADIYSLGVVFYELLTGELPIGRFAPPSKKVQIDVRLDEVVLRALEKEPEQRYQHASQVKSEVEAIRSVPNAPARPSQRRSHQQWPIGTMLAALLAFSASFMPWGMVPVTVEIRPEARDMYIGGMKVKFTPDTTTTTVEAVITGWNSNLTLGDVAIPNWTLAIVALIVAALALLHAATAYSTRHFVLILSTYAVAQAGSMCWFLLDRGHIGIGAPVTLAAYLVILGANIAPLITRPIARIVAKQSPAAPRLARIAATVALIGNFVSASLAYSMTAAIVGGQAFPPAGRMAAAFFVSLAIASVVYLAVLFSGNLPPWVIPIAEAISSKPLSAGAAFRATIRIALLASACGGIGLAAMLASRAPLFEHSQSTELFFALVFGFPINLLLAPLVYLVIRRKRTDGLPASAASAEAKLQPSHERSGRSGSESNSMSGATAALAGAKQAIPAPPRDRQYDLSGWVCAIIAVVLFTLGLVVPAVLIGIMGLVYSPAVPVTFLVCMVLAVLFGLVGRRYSLGRYVAVTALMILLGALAVQFFRSDRPEQHGPWKSDSDRLRGGAQRSIIPPVAEPQSDLLGKPLVVAGRTTTGKTLTSADWKGKVVLVVFWATWAYPCTEELPRLKELYKAYHAKGLEVVGVDSDDNDNTVNSFIKKKEVPWPQLREESQTDGEDWHPLAKQWGVKGIPTMFLVDKKGVLRFVDARKDTAEKIATLLAE